MTDLNERVQARLLDLTGYANGNYGEQVPVRDVVLHAAWATPSFGLRMVSSWRERWERHKPYPMLGGGAVCPTCVAVGLFAKADQVEAPCTEALTILREIGIEP